MGVVKVLSLSKKHKLNVLNKMCLPSCSETVPCQNINNEETKLNFATRIQAIEVGINLTQVAAH